MSNKEEFYQVLVLAQQNMDPEVFLKKLAGFLEDNQQYVPELQWFFRNSDNEGRRPSNPHYSCY